MPLLSAIRGNKGQPAAITGQAENGVLLQSEKTHSAVWSRFDGAIRRARGSGRTEPQGTEPGMDMGGRRGAQIAGAAYLMLTRKCQPQASIKLSR